MKKEKKKKKRKQETVNENNGRKIKKGERMKVQRNINKQ